MASSNPSQLFLLADHIKLSLLERQRAISLNLDAGAQDGQISRSLEQFQSGVESLDGRANADHQEDLVRLKAQLSDLQSQFHGFAPTDSSTLTTPNSASLAPDFSAAQRKSPRSASKSVRFRDNDDDAPGDASFPVHYTDEPQESTTPDQSHLDNQQIHEYHHQVMRDQDEQLDSLGMSIGRQRQLGMQIGDELDSHALLLEDVEEGVDRHQTQLDRARKNVDKFAKKAKDNWSLTLIVVLIIILVLLIVILK